MSHVPRLLLVDEDQALARTLSRILREHGYDVVAATGGPALVDALAGEPFDLVLLDPAPGDDATPAQVEAACQAPAWRHARVLVASALPPDAAVLARFGLAPGEYLAKPFRVHELLARVKGQLRRAREQDAARFEQRSRAEMSDILADVAAALQPDEIHRILVRRVAQGLRIPRCSIILARPGDATGTVVAASENPTLRDLRVDLARYPEIRRALETGEPVLVADVATDPLYEQERAAWDAEGRPLPARSAIALRYELHGTPAGVFFLRTTSAEAPLDRTDLAFVQRIIQAAAGALERAQAVERALAEGAVVPLGDELDPGTASATRAAFTRRLADEMPRAERDGQTLACCALELDQAGKVEVAWGESYAAEVLRQLAHLLRRELRGMDLLGRLGGASFAVCLPESSLADGRGFAERMVRKVAAHAFGESGRSVRLTLSAGVVAWPDPRVAGAEALVELAERRLDEARRAGGNRVSA